MMRIVFVTGSLVHGGAERHSITLMNQLAERGHECHAVYIKNDPSQLERIKPYRNGSVRCLNASRYFDRRALNEFAAYLKRVEPTIIVAANAYALLYASLARRQAQLRVPLLVTFHSTLLLGLKERVKMLIERFFFRAADCLVFVCESQRRYWLRRGLCARRNEVIHNGIDTDHFRADSFVDAAQEVRRQYGFAATDYVVGMVAVLRPEKNHIHLLQAVAALRAEGLPAKALLIGDGVMRQAIEALARHLEIEPFVVITGFQKDVRPYVAACDVVALCSVTEAFSLAAIEAMAMGKPVVHSDVGGAAEMITPAYNGFLFPMGDIRVLARQLALLVEPTRVQRMGGNARALVERQFSECAMVDRYEQTLLSLCEARSDKRNVIARQARDSSWRAIKNDRQARSESP